MRSYFFLQIRINKAIVKSFNGDWVKLVSFGYL